MNNIKFDFEDLTIVHAVLSDVDSRTQISLEYLPLFVAPMDTVVDENNVEIFTNQGYQVCMPRKEGVPAHLTDEIFHSFGLDEIINMMDSGEALPKKVLIDVANGAMRKLYETSKRIKTEFPSVVLMVGNIANPETYRLYSEIGVDYIRVGIGGGSACTTSANAAIHYPMASLIKECYDIACTMDNPTKIIADGGFKKYDDIIKALALGADYVMIGGILNKTIESCGDKYVHSTSSSEGKTGVTNWTKISQTTAELLFKEGKHISTNYRGMSTKEVQVKWGKKEIKTSEGISKFNKIEYTLAGWTKNMISYLKSNMSYSGKFNLETYKGEAQYVFITENAKARFRK
jgi:IMP dehydrogenase/GMP reductase